tara:strand:+ start:465 stop:725 length:261 start_codon:yes stop_codon:yes gene_type:complete
VQTKKNNSNEFSERRQRLHEIVIAIIQRQEKFELMENEPSLNENLGKYSEIVDPAVLIEKNKRILSNYESIVRTALTIDSLLDSKN